MTHGKTIVQPPLATTVMMALARAIVKSHGEQGMDLQHMDSWIPKNKPLILSFPVTWVGVPRLEHRFPSNGPN